MVQALQPSRALRVLAILVGTGVALALLLLLLLVLFVRSDAFEAQVKERVLPRVSQRLGREVTVERIEGKVLPSPRVRVGGVRVAGQTEVPSFTAESIVAGLRIWPLIASRGDRMVLDRLDFEAPALHVVRLPSGAWDIPRPPPSERRTEVDLENITLSEGQIHVIDSQGRSLLEIAAITGGASFIASALELRTLTARAYGAEIDAGGSRFDVGAEPMAWRLDAGVEDLSLQELPSRVDPLRGILAFRADITGEDVLPARMGKTASGSGAIEGSDLVWRTLDLPRGIAASLGALLEQAGLPIVAEQEPAETRLGSLERSVNVRNGWVELQEPVRFDSPAGPTQLGGRWRLGAQIDLEGQTQLSEAFVTSLTRGELSPDDPVPIRYRIRGSFANPRIEQVDPSAFVPLLAEEGARRLRRGLERILPPFGTELPPK